MRKTLVQQMTCNVVIRQMLFQTAGAINNMTISEKNMMELIVRNKKLGCNHCAKLDSLHKKRISCVTRMEKLQHFSFGKRYNSPASISSKKNERTFFFKNTSYLLRATATSCK